MTGGGVLFERVEELHEMRLEHLLPCATLQIVEKRAAAGDTTEIDQRRRGSDVFTGQTKGFIDASHRVPDVDPQIPERIQEPFRKRADERVLRIVAKENHVDIAIQPERRAPVASHRDQGDPASGLLTEGASCSVGGAVECAQETVERPCVGAGGRHAWVAAAHRVLERPAISTEVPTAGLAERRCQTTQIDDRARYFRQRSASMTVGHCDGNQSAHRRLRYAAMPDATP